MDAEYSGPLSLSDTIAIYKPTEACECGSCDHNQVINWGHKTIHWVCAVCSYQSIMYGYCSDENAAFLYKDAKKAK